MKWATFNIYAFSASAQNAVLTDLLLPFFEEAFRQNAIELFFFDRYDARGPHLFVVFGSRVTSLEELIAELAARLETFLAAHPCSLELAEEELATRHASCRGRFQNSLDGLPGMAANNSFAWAEHFPASYPLAFGVDKAEAGELLRALSEEAFFTIGQVAARRGQVAQGAALRCLATVDSVLGRLGRDREEFWRRYLGTLLVHLEDRLVGEPAEEVAQSLLAAVSEGNQRIFTRVFAAVAQPGGETEPVARRVEATLARLPGDAAWKYLRAITHSSLKGLGLQVAQEIPAIIFAWRRSFGPHPAQS